MNILFKLRRIPILITCRKFFLKTKEDYISFIKKLADEYEALTPVISDKNAQKQADLNNLFSKIEEHDQLGAEYGFPYSLKLTDKENALAIMNHLSEHTFYCGASRNILPDDGAEILSNSFDKPFTKALNCRTKAIALTDVLNSYGIKALPVCAMSENGVHFLVNVYLKEENRFIVLDPSFNCCFTDESGKELSVYELRDRILSNEKVVLNNYSFFGTNEYKEYYFSAFICDLMSNLSTWQTNIRTKKMLSKACGVEFDAVIPKEI